jgi:hypothetical protein
MLSITIKDKTIERTIITTKEGQRYRAAAALAPQFAAAQWISAISK